MQKTLSTCFQNLRYFLPALWFLLPFVGFSQNAAPQVIDVSKIRFQMDVGDSCYLAETDVAPPNIQQILKLPFKSNPLKRGNRKIPLNFMEETLILNFTIKNSSDTLEELYFTPGYYTRNLRIFKADPRSIANTLTQLPDSAMKSTIYPGAKLLKIQPGEYSTYYASFNFIRTNANNFSPFLVEKDFIRFWVKQVKYRDQLVDVSTYIISGILLLMIFYSLAAYLQNRNKEYLYYAIYAFCSTILFFFKSYSLTESKELNFLYEEYLDFIILSLGVYCYLIFVRWFIKTKEDHPILHKYLGISNKILLGFLVIFSAVYFFTSKFELLFILENYVTKVFLFLIGVLFFTYSLKRKDPLLNYLAAGNMALIIFSILSFMSLLGFVFNKKDPSSIFNKGLLYYEVGVALELIFFLSGLAYKNRRDLTERVQERERFKMETERKEFEKQIAIVTTRQEERDRISADMHDELGSGMTAIRLLSEIVKTKMKDQAYPEIEKISHSANDLLGKMNSIIWTMKSSNDSLESLVAYIRAQSLEYFDNTDIICRVFVPDHIPATEMSGEKRRNIFLSVKESLHNIVKHAQATEVIITLQLKDKSLIITVSDNGKGIDKEKLRRFGNGLSNMKRRMESIGGDFNAETLNGTVITFVSPI